MSVDDGSPPYVYDRSSEEEESPQEESSESEEGVNNYIYYI